MEAGGDAARDITAAIGSLAGDIIDMRFLVDDVKDATALIIRNQDVQSAQLRALSEQRAAQAADLRMMREDIAVYLRRGGVSAAGRTAIPSGERECPYRPRDRNRSCVRISRRPRTTFARVAPNITGGAPSTDTAFRLDKISRRGIGACDC